MDKMQTLGDLAQKWSCCSKCPLLSADRHNIVFGYGNPNSQVLIIGEAPGVNEDKEGVPFVGRAGALLDEFLAATSARDDVNDYIKWAEQHPKEFDQKVLRALLSQEFFFCNMVMCRPPENRDPTPTELANCKERLYETIYIIDPVIIIAVGGIAVESLIGRRGVAITQVRGQLFDIEVPSRTGIKLVYPLLATLHTSYILRRNDLKSDSGDGTKTYQDYLRAMKIVDEWNWRHHAVPHPTKRPIL